MIKKYFLFIIINFNLLFNVFPENNILLRPITKILMHDNFTSDELNPFSNSLKKLQLDEKSLLELIEEYEYTNGFYKDILKVKVIEGFYKGEIGYVIEDNVSLYKNNKSEIQVFFKDKTYIEEYDLTINKDIKCIIEESFVLNNDEILRLKIDSEKFNYRIIEIKDKSIVHFIVNKYSEINYNIRRGFKIIKVVDTETLLPVKDAEFKDCKSDQSGIMYIDSKKYNTFYKITKDGYSFYIINPSKEENIFLCPLTPIDYIKYYDDRARVIEKNNFKIIINNRNYSQDKKIKYKNFSLNDLSIISLPEYKNLPGVIISGFFIDNISDYSDTSCEIKNIEDNSEVYYFDQNMIKWIKINVYYDKIKKIILINKLNDGYYIVLNKENSIDIKNINIYFNNQYSSGIFIKNRKGNNFNQINISKEININLNTGEYEILYFNILEPYKINHKTFNIDKNTTSLNLDILKDQREYLNENDKGFSYLYYGKWKKMAIKYNDSFVEKKDLNVVEFLGNMTIEESNKINFKNNEYVIKGYYEIIDKKRIKIYLISINKLIKTQYKDEIIKVDCSLFNSELVIPAYYSLNAGILQISFDMIFFNRNKILSQKSIDDSLLIMDSFPVSYEQFPQSESLSKYKIFFSQ